MRRWIVLLAVWSGLAGCAPTAAADAPFPWGVRGRSLVDANGAPVLIHGEAAWALAVRLNREDASAYFADRERRGFNAIIFTIVDHHTDTDRNAYGEEPFPDGPFRKPNEAYFRHVDWLIDEAARHGIAVIVAPAYLGYFCSWQGWCSDIKRLDIATARAWGKFLGARYRDKPNLIWLEGGDTDARAFGVFGQVTAIAEGIHQEAPSQLHAAHCHRNTLGSDCYPWSWMQLETVYGECGTTTWLSQHAFERGKRPFFVVEARYEGDNPGPGCLRRQFIASVLAGASGEIYGNRDVRIFSPGWASHLDSPGARDVSWAAGLLRALHWDDLGPLGAGSGAADLRGPRLAGDLFPSGSPEALVSAVSPDRGRIVSYLPGPRALTLEVPAGDPRWCAAWIAAPGREAIALAVSRVAQGWRIPAAPGSGDGVLALQRCR